MNSFDKFVSRLAYFGAAINGDYKQIETEYQDLEAFVLEASSNLSSDTRVTQAFILWATRYGCLFSPSKLRRLIRDGTPYDRATLGAILEIVQASEARLQSWKILKPYLKKAKDEPPLFPHLPRPRSGLNPYFQKWGILAPALNESENKYLLPSQTVFKRCPELRYRAEGVTLVAADVRAFKDKNPGPEFSLYKIAKLTHHPRAQVNGYVRQLFRLDFFDSKMIQI
jgi:hypothetical protein